MDSLESTSTIKLKKAVSKFAVNVVGWSNTSRKVGDLLASTPTTCCGCLWNLQIYPGGYKSVHNGYLSLFLMNLSPHSVRVSYKLFIKNHSGGDDHYCNEDMLELNSMTDRGFPKFIQLDVLENSLSPFILDDKITFYAEITVYDEPEYLSVPPRLQTGSSSLLSDLEKMLADEGNADIVLEAADGDKIKAHRFILSARSPVFKAMFSSAMKESSENSCVRIADTGSVVLKAFVNYLYSDRCSDTLLSDHVTQLLHVACKYQVESLVLRCEDFIMRNVSTSSAAPMLQLADQYQLVNLKKHILQFMASNLDVCLSSTTFDSAMGLELCKDLLRTSATSPSVAISAIKKRRLSTDSPLPEPNNRSTSSGNEYWQG